MGGKNVLDRREEGIFEGNKKPSKFWSHVRKQLGDRSEGEHGREANTTSLLVSLYSHCMMMVCNIMLPGYAAGIGLI
jgi:hypothetical protein